MFNPGDPEATDCTCPREPNANGQGASGLVQTSAPMTLWLVAEECPLHGKSTWREKKS